MRVVVTGGEGFLGSHLCERLWRTGARRSVSTASSSDGRATLSTCSPSPVSGCCVETCPDR
ncbi:NAD-dependent epimerase/dehydratase family protein [Candidatus Protofrankia californiensis]|uniref:NAD-dependent epimerase/dehydratase family protein n=1 Tax=Candidatus Protofrankia californiensis TaxID=1839754 RepID=UPI003204C256